MRKIFVDGAQSVYLYFSYFIIKSYGWFILVMQHWKLNLTTSTVSRHLHTCTPTHVEAHSGTFPVNSFPAICGSESNVF